MHDEPFCPRQISFLLNGAPSVRVTATETEGGTITFVADVENTGSATADLRALFFQINEAKAAGLSVASTDPLVTDKAVLLNGVIDLGQGANLNGFAAPFDVGVEFGSSGVAKDLVDGPVTFVLSNTAANLTLDDLTGMQFGARLDAVPGSGGAGGPVTKLLGIAPAAPDAIDDNFNIFEDGAAGLDSPSKASSGVTFNLLANDTDADTPPSNLTITLIHEGPSHGTVTIAADGKSVIYSPTTDYSGADSFEYCISDGSGGQDSAVCNINIAAVADTPTISWTVAQGSDINEILLNVTATQNDADGSEFMDDIVLSVAGGAPAGVTLTPPSYDPAGSPNSITKLFTIDTAAATDYNFKIDIAATSQEFSNGDQQDGVRSQTVVIDYTHNFDTLDYAITDQSIWSSGDAFTFHQEPFFGFETSVSASGGDPEYIDTSYDIGAHIKTGFQATIDFNAGDIDASIPIDLTVDTTYNKTTDTILINPLMALGSGGSFTAHGPSGEFKLDFIFNFDGHAFAQILGGEIINTNWDYDHTENIIDVDSDDAAVNFSPIPGVVDISFAWPNITTTNSPGVLEGSGESNSFLTANLDVDALANTLLGGALSFIDPDPLDPGNLELLDVDISGSLTMLQDFLISLGSQSVTLQWEDGATQSLTMGTALQLSGVSTHDANHDGIVDFSFELAPNLSLSNDTGIGVSLDMHLAIGKNVPVIGTIYEDTFLLFGTSIDVYENTFQLTGVSPQTYEFHV